MATRSKKLLLMSMASGMILLLSSFFKEDMKSDKAKYKFPWKQAGLTERQAAAHLLNRFTFGPTPEQVDEVLKMGLEKWFQQQLNGGMADDALNARLSDLDALTMSNQQILDNFPRPVQVRQMAIKDGKISKDDVDNKEDKKEYREALAAYMKEKGIRPQQELFRQYINQKIYRAAYSNNQLQEVLTDFWFNHFNVSITKNDCAPFIPAYERDVIRPNVFGKFSDLLLATAKSPAMLFYLDNFSSAGTNSSFEKAGNGMFRQKLEQRMEKRLNDDDPDNDKQALKKLQQAKKNQGLNENYAREVMELHTLGVDGGYTQQDVTQAAKVLTGWTVYPMNDQGAMGAIRKLIERIGEDKLTARGMVHEGDFLFAPNRHDDSEKQVLGKTFASGGGYEEGVQLLQMLARHPSTANFICKKIATRFVNDAPPASLIDKMAKTFKDKDGDIRQVLITMVSSPEFWSKDAVREKTRSPFEYAIGAVRALNAEVKMPMLLNNWITRMGQKLYFYQAPTGFPDKGQYWINTGSLLNRMNFGLSLATQRIPGISFDLAAINDHKEPESAQEALATYAKLLLPERDVEETIKRLTPMINDPNYSQRIEDAANKVQKDAPKEDDEMMMNGKEPKEKLGKKGDLRNADDLMRIQSAKANNSMLNQVVGIIIGSPEFQRK